MINANQGVSATNAVGHGHGGDLKCATATFTVSSAITAGQVIPMLAVPAGARVVDAKLAVDGVTGGTFDLGDATDAARFMTAAEPGSSLSKGCLTLYKKSTVLSLTAATAPMGTSGAIKLAVFYVVDGVSPRDA